MSATDRFSTPKISLQKVDSPTKTPNRLTAESLRRFTHQRVLLYGLPVDRLTMSQVIELCDEALHTRRRLLLGVVNAAKIVAMGRDTALRDSLLDCDLILPDGQSVVWASRLLGRRLPERVTGIDIFEQLLILAERTNRSVFLLGATDQVLGALQTNLQTRFPRLRIAGARNGYFGEDETPDVADQIRASGADLLFLGISSPKKERFLADYGDSLGVPVQHGVGGSFDIFAGVTERAPLSWQRLGLEWAYRLHQEPGRMWRRYLTTNPAFIIKTPLELFRPTPAYVRTAQRRVIDLRGPIATMTSRPGITTEASDARNA